MLPSRKTVFTAATAALALAAFAATTLHASRSHAASDAAAGFPSKPVRIIVPVAPGGSADKLTRTLADRLGALWGQSVIVENVAGASGTIGAARVAKAAPDGYTLLQQGEGLTLNGILFRGLPYDTDKSFTPIIKAVVNPQILVVHPATGITSLADYVARARARPESISLGLPGNGGIAHVAHEILSQETGARVNYIPYPGGGPATVDVLAGHTDATLITLAAVTDHVRAGKLRALAVTTSYRSPALPTVPTVAEAGGPPGFSVESWQGYFAPAGTPPAIVEKINRDIAAVLQAPDVRAQLESQGFQVAGGSPGDLAQSLRAEQPRYAQAIRTAGLALR
ncbi:tripartite tricarboxylate transporter substrate binding protein [Acidovorax sp. NCPPB 3859]|nr:MULTISPECIES: tripartite tricarboxylate transporter substrate binding protein [unclassified Acidovorax]MDA8449286.1 tripartite tricarboxylate transporter substrate binding protein [Acidovorax sp. GBBC 3297]MDA8458625.1 tripartite tricarboxylate transporter substrate binding protein [Acidovorax sp. GBBC 3333]MDA8463663.1 tripartite tricarboxylate transporter substrate binding protein [Acidovorax sp. GBBC 3332]MDA8468466.1 tripartite tricarboxylate transporter substrate binding protein [Acidov